MKIQSQSDHWHGTVHPEVETEETLSPDAVLEVIRVSKDRAALIQRMTEAFAAGDTTAVLELAKVLCGIREEGRLDELSGDWAM